MEEATNAFFADQALNPANTACVDCGAANPQWAALLYGTYICLECSGQHRALGTHLSFVRSTVLDNWKSSQMRVMELGGNAEFLSFLERYGLAHGTPIACKYRTRACEFYRLRLRAAAEGRSIAADEPTPNAGLEAIEPVPVAVTSARKAPTAKVPDAWSRERAVSLVVSPERARQIAEANAFFLESLLEAWEDCHPEGCSMPQDYTEKMLPAIAKRMPGSWENPDTAQTLLELFTPAADSVPLFERMLCFHEGRLHFLHFWRAFSKAAQLVCRIGSDGLILELETLRDGVLRGQEVAVLSAESSHMTSLPDLVLEVQRTGAMSDFPEFWKAAEQRLNELGEQMSVVILGFEALAIIFKAWLRDAMSSLRSRLGMSAHVPTNGAKEKTTRVLRKRNSKTSAGIAKIPQSTDLRVRLHVYDGSQEEGLRQLNQVLAQKDQSTKLGRNFHVGVEINGLEWSFATPLTATQPGVSCIKPKRKAEYRFRQTIKLGKSNLTAEAVAEIVMQIADEYPGNDYDAVKRNSCHFADDFCQRLGVAGIPRWIHSRAYIAAQVDSIMQTFAIK